MVLAPGATFGTEEWEQSDELGTQLQYSFTTGPDERTQVVISGNIGGRGLETFLIIFSALVALQHVSQASKHRKKKRKFHSHKNCQTRFCTLLVRETGFRITIFYHLLAQ